MQQKTLQNLIYATTDFILFFVSCFLQAIFFFLKFTCNFVDHFRFIRPLHQACCKKRVQQEPESQQMDFQACCKKRVQQEPESQLMHFYKKEVCTADTQDETQAGVCAITQDDHDKWLQTMEESENTPNVFNMAGLTRLDGV